MLPESTTRSVRPAVNRSGKRTLARLSSGCPWTGRSGRRRKQRSARSNQTALVPCTGATERHPTEQPDAGRSRGSNGHQAPRSPYGCAGWERTASNAPSGACRENPHAGLVEPRVEIVVAPDVLCS